MIEHFSLVQQALAQLDYNAVQRAIDIIKAAKQRGSMVFICGNGGSAATASHFACDLQKAAGVRAIALTDNVPLITAWANDTEYSQVFKQQFNVFDPRPSSIRADKDVVILISCSGHSDNIREMQTRVQPWGGSYADLIILFGEQGRAALNKKWDNTQEKLEVAVVFVQSADYGVIEDVHLSICHAITKGVASEGG